MSVDTHEQLAQRLEELLEVETFPPPEEFARDALLSDPEVYARAAADPLAWWEEKARELHWFTEWANTLEDSDPPFYKWFTGGRINASYNCLDRHVEAGIGDRVAFHWRGEEGEERDITYADLHRDVQRFANALRDLGIEKGDVVGIYLPMIPQVVVAMLACARIGAPHNVVFGGFSPESVKERMEVSEAKALITVDGARRKGRTAPIKQSVDEVGMPVQTTIVVRHTGIDCPMGDGDVFYDEVMEAAAPECPAEALDAEHPLYILYSSGSTAKPKGILHTTGGYLTGVAYTHKVVFDLKPETDVYFCSADVGWVTGHSYIVYGPLANGATQVLYEGTPDFPEKGRWWQIIEEYGVTIFYTAPTAIRTFMKQGRAIPDARDLSSVRLLGSVGEPINPEAYIWYRDVIGGSKVPVVDTWWQTETGAIMISPLPGVTHGKPGSAMKALPGVGADVVDDNGVSVPNGAGGYLVLTQPWPSMLRTIWGDDQRYIDTYWARFKDQGFYFAGDGAKKDEDGDVWVLGRVDDVMNVSGHRLSTTEIESALVSHPYVAEAAVVGATDPDTGQAVVAYVILRDGSPEDCHKELSDHVRKEIGPIAKPRQIMIVPELPKTRSGKIMRRLLRDLAEGRGVVDTTTLADQTIMDLIAAGKTTATDE